MRSRRRTPLLRLGFGAWDRLESGVPVVVVCHPEWRGVHTAAVASGAPIVETADAAFHAGMIVENLVARNVSRLVVHGYPPGAKRLFEQAKQQGLWTGCVLHSSPAQHGGEPWEAAVVDEVLDLGRIGVIDRIGFVKAGVAELLATLGHRTVHVPNRAPRRSLEPVRDLGPGLHIGVFAEPIFRKNVATQILAAAGFPDATIHVLEAPDVRYLRDLPIVEHGVIGFDAFQSLLGAVDLNLYVTLSECHPLTPIESYSAGVPCLVSATSELFADDDRLASLSIVSQHDNPAEIARAASRLLDHREEAVDLARSWIDRMDVRGAAAWEAFLELSP